MPLAHALSTWPQAQPLLEQIGHVKDPIWVEQLLDAATVRIENETGATFVQRSFTERRLGGAERRGSYVYGWRPEQYATRTREGRKRLYLDRYPIVSVTSITDEDSETVASGDYRILENLGVLEHDGVWPLPTGEWSIVYTAGRFADTDSVSEDVRLACNLLVAHWIGAREVQESGFAAAPIFDATLPPDVKALVLPYAARSV